MSERQHGRTTQIGGVPNIGRPDTPKSEVPTKHLLEIERELREWADRRESDSAHRDASRIRDMADFVNDSASTRVVDCVECGSGATIHADPPGVLECLQCETEFEP